MCSESPEIAGMVLDSSIAVAVKMVGRLLDRDCSGDDSGLESD